MLKKLLITLWIISFSATAASPAALAEDASTDAGAIVDKMFDYMRGKASISKVVMTIHRPDWERAMTIKAWTKGQSDSYFVITSPPKDEGNGTLKRGNEMWMYNPKVDRVIKLPPSMMSQSWMGSDFSNNDIAKSDSIIEDYTHTLEGTVNRDGETVYLITSMPKPAAPVVWGMQKLKIREDGIMLSEEFYDEDFTLVKALTTMEIRMIAGKLYPTVWRMQEAGAEDEYTELDYVELEFTQDLPDRIFTLSNLRSRRW